MRPPPDDVLLGLQLTSFSSVFGIMGEERVVVSRRREGRGRSPSPSAPSSAVSFALQLGVQPLCLVSLGRRGSSSVGGGRGGAGSAPSPLVFLALLRCVWGDLL